MPSIIHACLVSSRERLVIKLSLLLHGIKEVGNRLLMVPDRADVVAGGFVVLRLLVIVVVFQLNILLL
jgi:hypothetical protein